MSSPVYCILSGGAVHCVPVTAFNGATTSEPPAKLARKPAVAIDSDPLVPPLSLLPAILKIKNKNLLYTLNNPSLSDLESDAHATNDSRRLSGASHEEDDPNWDLPPLTPLRVPLAKPLLKIGLEVLANDIDESGIQDVVSGPNGTIDINIDSVEVSEDLTPVDLLSILEKYATHAIYLPQYSVDLQTNLDSDYTQIKTLLTKVFPSWTSDIHVKQLTGGITNMLLSCTHNPSNETLLMRVYGQGTNLIIDRHREFVSHLVLNALKLAPPIHARFSNGLIYGFLPGRSLDPKELSNPYLYPLIAQQLGNWHNRIDCDYIEDGVEKLRKYTAGLKKLFQLKSENTYKISKREKKIKRIISNIWDLIEDWILIVPANKALVNIFNTNLGDDKITEENVRDVVLREFNWLRSTLNRATKSPVVVSHCDLLSGNIIIPDLPDFAAQIDKAESDGNLPSLKDNPIQFIDYEYMLPAPRAFDIANHFAEWQGFDCDRSAIPEPSLDNPVMANWCRGYLNDSGSQLELESLINEIECYYGMPGFYWGIWAMIQSEISTIDFNYAEYSELRLEEYWVWKKKFLSKNA